MITINDKNYEFKYSIRAMFIWESITEKPFEITTLMDSYVFCYACLVANQDNPDLDFEAFINACDEDPSIIEKFNKFMNDEMKKRELLNKKKVMKKGKKESQ